MESPPTITWDTCDTAGWGGYISAAGKSNVEQSWAYGAAIATAPKWQVRRGVVSRDGAPIAIVQAFTRRFAGLATLVRVMRGPLALDGKAVTSDTLTAVARSFRKRRREIPLWLPELPAGAASTAAMAAVGKRQMVTGYSSAWIDLGGDERALRRRLKGTWRNQLKRAEDSGVAVEVNHGGPTLVALLETYDGLQKRAGFVAHKRDFYLAFAANAAARDVLVLSALADGEVIAAVLVLGHGDAATYTAGWTNDAGRSHHSHNLLLWRAAVALQQDGRRWLDMGGVETTRTPGITHFKLGMGGDAYTLAGTYL